MIYDPEARTLQIVTTIHDGQLGSSDAHCQSAYPDMYTQEMDASFYINRRTMNNVLAGMTITYTL